MKRIVLLVVLLASLMLAATETKRHFHIHQTSLASLEVKCDVGKPVASHAGDTSVIVVECK